jgi:Sulfocyanin (SoxE) domain
MRIFLLLLLAAAPALWAQTPAPAAPAKPAEPAPAADASHDAHAASSGIKKELIAGLQETDFIKLGDKDKTVKLLVVATWNQANYGMNFNGFAKGEAVYTIPKDWTVEVTFINPSPVPHSLIVLEKDQVKKLQSPEPYFKGAATAKHLQGIAYDKAAFTFTPDEAGEFVLACGFPAHASAGHWIALDVKEDAKVPTLKLGTKDAVEAKK